MSFKEWKEKRKQKRLERQDPYILEERRLKLKQRELDPLTDEYERLQAEIERFNKANRESRENRRRLTPEKASIWTKIIGGLGTVGAIVAVAKFEKDGIAATGEKRTIMDSLCRAAGNFLHK